MNSKKEIVIKLINDYVSCSKYMCKILKEAYDTKGETLLRARKINIIPKEGVLPEGFLFNFHGGGCYFRFENGSIDVDFGPNDRCDGFDGQRLYEFLKSSKREEVTILSETLISEILEYLLWEKVLTKPGWYPNPHLFYLDNN